MGQWLEWMGGCIRLKESQLYLVSKVLPGSVGPGKIGFGVKC